MAFRAFNRSAVSLAALGVLLVALSSCLYLVWHPVSTVLQENAKLHYGNPADFTLTVPQFSVKPGEVVAIVGRVGCGE